MGRKPKLPKHQAHSLASPRILERIAVFIHCPHTLFTYLSVQPVFALSPALRSLQFLAQSWSYKVLWPQLVLASFAEINEEQIKAIASALCIVPCIAVRDRLTRQSIVGKSCVRNDTKLHLSNLTTYQHVVDAIDAWATQVTQLVIAPPRPITHCAKSIGELFLKCTRLTQLTLRLRLENIHVFAMALQGNAPCLKEAKIILYQQRHHRIKLPFQLEELSIQAFTTFIVQVPIVSLTLDGIESLPKALCTGMYQACSILSMEFNNCVDPLSQMMDGSPFPTQWKRLSLEAIKLTSLLQANLTSAIEDCHIEHLTLVDFSYEQLASTITNLPTLVQLQSLELKHISMQHDDVVAFASVVGQLPLVVEFILTGNELSDTALEVLTSAFTQCKYLDHLDLSCNAMTSIDCIANLLAKCRGLKRLLLACNQITCSGVRGISKSIATHRTLQYLDLASNALGTQAVMDLISCAHSSTIFMDVSDNGANLEQCQEHVLALGLEKRIKLQQSEVWNVP